MLTSYILAAMRRAKYEILADGTYYGEIPGFQGVYANAQALPVVDGIDLAVAPEPA